jgi:hypothetical protein
MRQFFSVWLKNFKEMVDPRKLSSSPAELARYVRDWHSFRRRYTGDYPLRLLPVLFERKRPVFDAQYVYQAYWATQRIIKSVSSGFHLDISSHIPFVAQLSAHLPVIQMEFNPPLVELPSLKRVSGSLVDLPFRDESILSLSCLHVIEHVGLGRYGDPVNTNGCWKALREIQRVMARGGQCFLSIPVGQQSIYFNAGYVFRFSDIINVLGRLDLLEFSLVDEKGKLKDFDSVQQAAETVHALGLFHFKKPINR